MELHRSTLALREELFHILGGAKKHPFWVAWRQHSVQDCWPEIEGHISCRQNQDLGLCEVLVSKQQRLQHLIPRHQGEKVFVSYILPAADSILLIVSQPAFCSICNANSKCVLCWLLACMYGGGPAWKGRLVSIFFL